MKKQVFPLKRRDFFKLTTAGMTGLAVSTGLKAQEKVQEHAPETKPPAKISTNIEEIRDIPRTKDSMPGKYPGKVVKLSTPGVSVKGEVSAEKVKKAVERGILELTGQSDLKKA